MRILKIVLIFKNLINFLRVCAVRGPYCVVMNSKNGNGVKKRMVTPT